MFGVRSARNKPSFSGTANTRTKFDASQLLYSCQPGSGPLASGRGEPGKGDTLINEIIIGTVFKGRMPGETTAGDFKAFVYGFATWIVDNSDPLTYGFLVRQATPQGL